MTLPKFRKRPVEIEAVLMTAELYFEADHNMDGGRAEWPDWLEAAFSDGTITLDGPASDVACVIRTLEGDHQCLFGDWIIRGVKGELYPCKPDIFEMTYESVAPAGPPA